MKSKETTTVTSPEKRNSERGSAILVAVMFMAILFVISMAAARVRVASARDIDNHETQQKEYWGARSDAAVLEASLRSDIPSRFTSDLQTAKYYAGGRSLPAFDSRTVELTGSRPVIDTDGNRTQYPINTCTSLLGQVDGWATARTTVPEEYARDLGYGGRVAVLREAYRQQLSSSIPTNEPAYVLEFYIDAAAGENGHVRPSGTLMLGPAIIGCNTTVTLAASPDTIIVGSPANLIITYTNASRIVVTDAAGNTIANQEVSESSATQTLTVPVTPAATTTYTAVATSSGGCSATSAPKTITVNIPPPQILAFSANPPCIPLGGSSQLSWTITGATNATINGTPVNPSSGTMTVTPSTTTTYTLVATNSSGSVQAQATVSVSIPPRINLFNANPACAIPGGSALLQWNVADAASVTINGTPVDPISGTMTVTPATDTTYTIVATSGGCLAQTAQAQVTVSVATLPQIILFTATPDSITLGGSAVIQWSITGATSASINGSAVNPMSGTLTVSPTVTTTYTLIATSGGCSPQQAQAQVTITVTAMPTPTPTPTPNEGLCPSITSFTGAPSCILPGQSAQLQYLVANADAVTINGTSVSPSTGTITVTPSTTTTYTLVASKSGCPSRQAQVTIQVGESPTITAFTATPSSVQQGGGSDLNWSVTNAATVTIDGTLVNPASGSLRVTPSSTHTYTLIATSGGCSPQQVQAQVTVNVTACPSIAYFTATPASILQGSSAVLQWSVSGAISVTINGTGVSATGSMTVSPATTTAYVLLAQSASGLCDVQSSVTVMVSACAVPQIVSFTANPNSVNQGGSALVRLSWVINDTTGTGITVTITPGVGSYNSATGFVEMTQPQSNSTYTLTARNGCGASAQIQVMVTVVAAPQTCEEQLAGKLALPNTSSYYLNKTETFTHLGKEIRATISMVVVPETYTAPGGPFDGLYLYRHTQCYQITLTSPDPTILTLLYSKQPFDDNLLFLSDPQNLDPTFVDTIPEFRHSKIQFAASGSGLGTYRTSTPYDVNDPDERPAGDLGGQVYPNTLSYLIRGQVGGSDFAKITRIDYINLFYPFPQVDPLLNGEIYAGAPGGGRGPLEFRVVNGRLASP